MFIQNPCFSIYMNSFQISTPLPSTVHFLLWSYFMFTLLKSTETLHNGTSWITKIFFNPESTYICITLPLRSGHFRIARNFCGPEVSAVQRCLLFRGFPILLMHCFNSPESWKRRSFWIEPVVFEGSVEFGSHLWHGVEVHFRVFPAVLLFFRNIRWAFQQTEEFVDASRSCRTARRSKDEFERKQRRKIFNPSVSICLIWYN